MFNRPSALMAARARIWPVLASVAILVVLSGAIVTQADDPNRVGLVVVHGDGNVLTRCVEFEEDEISGYDVLDRSGLDLNIEPSGGMGVTVCRIDDEGCTFPQEPCFCQCVGGGSACIYWSYWHLTGSGWQYSGTGASNHAVGDGDVEGWVWGIGTISGASPPPLIPFEDICAPAIPSPAPTVTSTPTNTPAPTNTPQPPTIAYFSADRTTINAGESVLLSWDLSDAKAAYLRYEGNEEGVVAPGTRLVSPATTTVYTLIARNDGGETTAEVTITVISITDTPTNTPLATESLPPSATPSSTSLPSAEPGASPSPEKPVAPPTDTPSPALVVETTSVPLAPPSPLPSVTASAIPTPVPVAVATPDLGVGTGATPPPLLRDTSANSGPDIPVLVLGVVGVIALLGGLAGMVLILLAIRRGTG